MRSIQHTASINRRLSWAGRPLLPSPPGKCGLNRSQTSSVISWRRCATVIPPPSTLSPFPAIYHPTAILTTPPSHPSDRHRGSRCRRRGRRGSPQLQFQADTMGVVPRQSFLPVGVNALPHLKRYPKQVVDSNKMLPESQIYVMTLWRTTAGINKAEDAGRAGRKDAQIGSADALRRIFPTALASYLQFRGWIRQETLCDRSSVTFD